MPHETLPLYYAAPPLGSINVLSFPRMAGMDCVCQRRGGQLSNMPHKDSVHESLHYVELHHVLNFLSTEMYLSAQA
jgi:hypothetical protein